MKAMAAEREAMQRLDPWHGRCDLQFRAANGSTRHQGGCTAPFKLLRSEHGDDGRCELPVLHTAGGLVGGDQLSLAINLATNSRSLITSVAAQKVYGSIGRSRLQPEGCSAQQHVCCSLASGSDLEWLPQELVLYADALFEQHLTVTLPMDASFVSAESCAWVEPPLVKPCSKGDGGPASRFSASPQPARHGSWLIAWNWAEPAWRAPMA